jgi:hypothetical protein
MPTLGQMVLERVTTQHGQKLAQAATKLGVHEDNLLHLVLDIHIDIQGFAEFPGHLVDLIEKPLPSASCYPMAEALFPVIADATNGQHGGSPLKKSFEAAGPFQLAVAGLVTAIRQAVQGGHDTVFRVEYGGHGFTLVARRPDPQGAPRIELIETIANLAMLLPSLRAAAMDPDAVTTGLTRMADDNIDIRKQGAGTFNWDAADFWLAEQTGSDPVFPNVAFRWWSGALRPDAVDRWTGQFASRLAVLAKAK